MLRIEGLVKRFGGLIAVDRLDFAVEAGEIVGLLGPNGSGKTTVMNLVSGALAPSEGSIRLDGIELARMPAHRIARRGIARTFQLVRVLESMSCLENVLAGMAFCAARRFGRDAHAQSSALLARVGLAGREQDPARDLTYVDRKRLELARALAARPRLLLLDEWLAGLNPSELREGVELLRRLREEGTTMVLVEHVMDAIRSLCDRCVVMNAGRKIADAPPREALSDPQVVRAYLGDDDARP
ncbi:MAG: ATP-binding cassette domain-containing protein [Burkholderiaceae bacterium]|jgi:branched-chain amino acid transport system ATP-binding protein|nr:ATP-binding cassette domain-containing protein [Burkholderiaceae bacterium]MEB2350421.1 ATP-binding cassette domain-containing protein [Burkholderiaceae bacterium]